jgi:hypothetical protein
LYENYILPFPKNHIPVSIDIIWNWTKRHIYVYIYITKKKVLKIKGSWDSHDYLVVWTNNYIMCSYHWDSPTWLVKRMTQDFEIENLYVNEVHNHSTTTTSRCSSFSELCHNFIFILIFIDCIKIWKIIIAYRGK